MRTITAREHELLDRILRRIDRKATFHAHHRDDGDIAIEIAARNRKTMTQVPPAVLEASTADAVQFQALRGKIKRVYDRMRAPVPPPKTPKVEARKDIAFGFRPSGRGRR